MELLGGVGKNIEGGCDGGKGLGTGSPGALEEQESE